MVPTCFSSVVLYREWMWPPRVSRVSLARLPTSLLSGIVSTMSTVSTLCAATSTAGCRLPLSWCRKCPPEECSLLLHHLTSSRSPQPGPPPRESLQTANQDQHYLIWYCGSWRCQSPSTQQLVVGHRAHDIMLLAVHYSLSMSKIRYQQQSG